MARTVHVALLISLTACWPDRSERHAEARRLLEGARTDLAQGHLLTARTGTRASLELHDTVAARALAWSLRREPVQWTLQEPAEALAWGPDGLWVGVDHGLRSLDRDDGHVLWEQSLDFTPRLIAIGTRVALADAEGVVTWMEGGRVVERSEAARGASPVSLHVEGSRTAMLAGAHQGPPGVWLWDELGAREIVLDADGPWGLSDLSVVLRPDAIWTGSGGKVLAWATHSLQAVDIFRDRMEDFRVLIPGPGGSLDLVGSRIQRLDPVSGGELASWSGPMDTAVAARWAGEHLVVVDQHATLFVHGPTGELVRRVACSERAASRMTQPLISEDGRYVVLGGEAGSAIVRTDVEPALPERGHGAAVTDLREALGRLYTAGEDGWVREWDPLTLQERRAWKAHAGPIRKLGFSLRREALLTVGADQEAALWNVYTTREQERWGKAARGDVAVVAAHAWGDRLVVAGDDGRIRVLDLMAEAVTSEEVIAAFEQGSEAVERLLTKTGPLPTWYVGEGIVDVRADSGSWVVGLANGGLYRVDLETGAVRSLVRHDNRLVSFEVRGDRVASHTSDGRVWLSELTGDRTVQIADGARAEGRVTWLTDGRLAWPRTDGTLGVRRPDGGVVHLQAADARVAAQGLRAPIVGTDFGGVRLAVVGPPGGGPDELCADVARWGRVCGRQGGDLGPLVLADAPAAPIGALSAGPAALLAAGFATGEIGVWNAEDGERLLRLRLAGAVSGLAWEGAVLRGRTDQGDELELDLSTWVPDSPLPLEGLPGGPPRLGDGAR